MCWVGFVKPTKLRKPLYLVYYEVYTSRQNATKREHNLKLRAKVLGQLNNRIKARLKA